MPKNANYFVVLVIHSLQEQYTFWILCSSKGLQIISKGLAKTSYIRFLTAHCMSYTPRVYSREMCSQHISPYVLVSF